METTVVSEGLAKRVRLWNDGPKTFDYKVSGERYVIQPGEYIELARRTAIHVRGFNPGKGVEVSLRIDPILKNREQEQITLTQADKVYACIKCDAEFTDKEEYASHMETHKRRRGRPAERIGDENEGDDE